MHFLLRTTTFTSRCGGFFSLVSTPSRRLTATAAASQENVASHASPPLSSSSPVSFRGSSQSDRGCGSMSQDNHSLHKDTLHSTSAAAAVGASSGSDTTSATPQSLALHKLVYRPRMGYTAPFRGSLLSDYMCCREEHAVSIAHTYKHHKDDITVTLIPLRHFAHPEFFSQVDSLCCQHESVLMEGRTPLTGAPFSTFVPPRARITQVRPLENDDDEGWEPREVEAFFQPFSWGVKDSQNFTVVHAADKYDYEKLPWWCSLRFNAPIVGSLQREKHCLDMLYPLRSNAYKSFAIPWGAGHMPIFREMLLDNGFEQISMCSLRVLSRIDGTVSEGEFDKMRRAEKRKARRWTYLRILGVLVSLYVFWSFTHVEYISGPRGPDD